MTVCKIAQWPHPMLSKQAKYTEVQPDTLRIAKNLRDTMRASLSVGLAAQQIRVLKSICVIDARFASDTMVPDELLDGVIVMVNPTIAAAGPKTVRIREECMSLPGVAEFVTRSEKINVTYQNLSGKFVRAQLGGNAAIIVQHEVDHLAGKLFIDRLQPRKYKAVVRKILFIKRRFEVMEARRLRREAKKDKKERIAASNDPIKNGFRNLAGKLTSKKTSKSRRKKK